VLRTPKGWTCPKEVDGKRVEDYWRAHQVPIGEMQENPAHVHILEEWMKSYRSAELFDDGGRLRPELAELALAARQWRHPPQRSAPARFPRLRHRGACARRRHSVGHAAHGVDSSAT